MDQIGQLTQCAQGLGRTRVKKTESHDVRFENRLHELIRRKMLELGLSQIKNKTQAWRFVCENAMPFTTCACSA